MNEKMEIKYGNGEREKMKKWREREKMRKWRCSGEKEKTLLKREEICLSISSFSLHYLSLSPFSHSPFPFHFLVCSPFPLHFLILSPFPFHFPSQFSLSLSIFSSFSHSPAIFSEATSQLPSTCAVLEYCVVLCGYCLGIVWYGIEVEIRRRDKTCGATFFCCVITN